MEPAVSRFRHIAIEGVIGVGKTTLARRLAAHFGAELLLEQAGENPYLGRYYDDPAGYAFQTQVFFLFQRLRQVTALAQPGMFSPAIVSDFMFAKDALFARMTLSDDEYALYSGRNAAMVALPPVVAARVPSRVSAAFSACTNNARTSPALRKRTSVLAGCTLTSISRGSSVTNSATSG